MAMVASGFRTNIMGRPVWDITRNGRFVATVVIQPDGNLIVLMGALQPRGKELAKEAIARAKETTR